MESKSGQSDWRIKIFEFSDGFEEQRPLKESRPSIPAAEEVLVSQRPDTQ